MGKMHKCIAALGTAVWGLSVLFMIPESTVFAETEPTYEVTVETAEAEAYIGEVVKTSELNVRTGFGAGYDRVQRSDDSYVVLGKGDLVAVMSSGKASNGDLWYEVRWVDSGVEYHGYVNANYVDMTEERAIPLPTPTPEPTPSPTPTPTPEPTPTPLPTPTPSPTPEPQKENGLFSILKGIGIVALLLIVVAIVYVVIMMKKREAAATNTNEKIDNLKNINLKKGPVGINGIPINIMKRKQEVVEEPRDSSSHQQQRGYESDAEMLARKEHARMVNAEIMEKSRFYDPNEEKRKEDELKHLSESLKEKELLREEIDNLNPGDLVYHEYFGKGVVFDNSDVKRIEIRFGTDVRFIDKAGCVAKKLMRKV